MSEKMTGAGEVIHDHLAFLYGEPEANRLTPILESKLARFGAKQEASQQRPFTEKDAILITYGDMVHAPGQKPLVTLERLLTRYAQSLINSVHILPFYPYSSDDGFSVIDYRAVDPALGGWEDIAALGQKFRLMFDGVINHISAKSEWFQEYLRGNPPYSDYFLTLAPDVDVTAVFRPRALPLLTPFNTSQGEKFVWTTFSADQIDLNFANPAVLLEIIDLLLFYVQQGAELIRLDAIAFMWKELGTSCIHLPQTHRIIQLIRSVLNVAAPHVALITETNVPHEENISYFGNGRNEAQMVYNFSLPPLTLHSFHTGNAEALSRWAATLTLPSEQVTFFNFLASHDGIGVTPARGVLDATAVSQMAQRVQQLGGFVSYKNNPDGSQSAYELNINYLDALGNPEAPNESTELIARRFLASQAIMLALRGVPGIYFHSLFGSRGWPAGVAQTGRSRTINRQKLELPNLEAELQTEGSLRQWVYHGYRSLLQARKNSTAFHPQGGQEVLHWHPAVFGLRRTAPDGSDVLICLHNVAETAVSLPLPAGSYLNLIDNQRLKSCGSITINPYQVYWLRKE